MTETSKEIPPLRILVVDDEANIRLTLGMCLEAEGHRVVGCGNIQDALDEIGRQVFDLVFLDIRLGMDNGLDFLPRLRSENPWAKVIVITAFASIETAVEAMKRGATDYLPKPFEAAQVQLVTRKVAEHRQMQRRIETLQAALGAMDAEADLPTNSPLMQQAIEVARQVATSQAPILIRGEPGTGRGRLARAIHMWSGRSAGPFASVSCQFPVDSLEAELFGISAADDHIGVDKAGAAAFCDGGTLLLEEVGQTPARLQAKLLRLLHDKEYERMDESRSRPSSVRVIATTAGDLQAIVRSGHFRSDLMLVLNVVEILVPPLRNRTEDLFMLAERYLAYFAKEHHRTVEGFTADASYAMSKYPWPGNVRELRNVVERATLLCRGEQIGIEHLPPNLLNSHLGYAVGDLVPLEKIERSHVMQVVAATRSLRRAASILGVDSSTLCRWMKRYGTSDDQPAA
jgi:NtrC-family two-component system response regulator AlgB